MKDSMNVDILDEETIGMTKRLVVIRISTSTSTSGCASLT